MKKIVFLVNSLGKGGAERVVVNLANEMVINNKVYIITLSNEKFYEIDSDIVHINLDINANSLIKKIRLFKSINKRIADEIDKISNGEKIDLITAHLPYTHLICSYNKYSSSIKYVIHTVYSKKANKIKFIRDFIIRKIYKNNHIISVSDGVANELKEVIKIDCNTMKRIYNPIDVSDIKEKAKETVEYSNKFIIFVGRLNRIKNVDFLIKQYSKSQMKHKYDFIIIGDGEERENLISLVNSLGEENRIKLLGWQNNPYKWIEKAELLVSASDYESFSMNIIESLACGTRVLSIDCDYGPREILKGDLRKYLVAKHDKEEFYKYLDKYIECTEENVSTYTDEYDIKNISKQYLELR